MCIILGCCLHYFGVLFTLFWGVVYTVLGHLFTLFWGVVYTILGFFFILFGGVGYAVVWGFWYSMGFLLESFWRLVLTRIGSGYHV